MMLHLILDVSDHAVFFGWTDSEGSVAVLPMEFQNRIAAFINVLAGIRF